MLGIYKIFIGGKPSFLRPFEGEGQEALYQQATIFWNQLDSIAFWLPFVVAIVGGGLAYYYYGPFNNKPGRHYLPKYWWGTMVVCAVVSFLLSLLIPMGLVGTSFKGSLGLECKLAFGNMIYSILFYLIISFIWCRWGKTNAYRYL